MKYLTGILTAIIGILGSLLAFANIKAAKKEAKQEKAGREAESKATEALLKGLENEAKPPVFDKRRRDHFK